MKLSNEALLEIVDIVRNGLATGTDVSQALRELDLDVANGDLALSREYKEKNGRV